MGSLSTGYENRNLITYFRNRDMQLVVEVSNEEDSNLAWTMVSGVQLRLLPPFATIKTVFSMVALNHGLQVGSIFELKLLLI